MATKTKVERVVWEWVDRENPGFKFNVMLLDTVFGEIFSPGDQGGSTAAMVRWVYDGEKMEMLNQIKPQWYIGAAVGRLCVAALATGVVDGSRVFCCAGKYSWKQVLEILKGMYPEREFKEVPDQGEDLTRGRT
ncbi:hypothetical protein B0T16DRAFT_452494 [Cercophora newfieldiana]|uniref:Uncharacterized protein n=1 Tax=Cercophora newfieldiana TaxID=92897 RepID=A0AA40CZB2_9PEZI|nr:hypothetical protein B0T16DRAFT_452494 [Cercophora newfieldiana]